MILRLEQAEELLRRIEESDKAISGAVARDKVMWSQTGIFMDIGLQDKKLMQQGMSLYNAAVSQMRADMMALVGEYRAGRVDMGAAITRFKTLTSDAYQKVFRAGAMAMGNPYYADPAIGLTKKDLSFISAARRYELGFFKKFLLDMSNPNFSPRHDFAKRSGYYADSAKAQFYNGMVNGAGENVEIKWILGMAEEHCGDCPILASKTYTWQTLPTTPRAGDTACLFNCQCHLEFNRRQSGPVGQGPAMPTGGTPTSQPINLSGRWSTVTNQAGEQMTGKIVKDFDDLFAQMNQARQRITLATDAEDKRFWIDMRKQLNQQIIDRMKKSDVRVTPTISVNDLLQAVRDAKTKAAGGVLTIPEMTAGKEVVLITGDRVVIGVISHVGGRIYIDTAAGSHFEHDMFKDIVIAIRPDAPVASLPPAPSPSPQAPPSGTAVPREPQYQEFGQYAKHTRDWRDIAFTEARDAVARSVKYTDMQMSTISDYQGFGYTAYNGYLRSGNVPGGSTLRGIKDGLKQLDAAMNKGRTTHDMVLHRVSHVSQFGENLRPGQVVVDPGYISASTQSEGVEAMARSTKWRIRIMVPEGTPAISMPDARATGRARDWRSVNPTTLDELEIVLPRNSRLRITEIDNDSKILSMEWIGIA